MSQWQKVPLNKVAEIERDSINPSAITDGTTYVGLENIETGGLFVNVRKVTKGELASSKFAFTDKHILYGKLRPYLAKIARPTFSGICSTDILPILPNSAINRDYLTHFLCQSSMIELATSRSTGANLPRLSPKILAEFLIPLPPIEQQKRIAAILDKAEELRRLRGQSIEQLDVLSRSLFIEMFGDPSKNPKGWEKVDLGSVGSVQGGLQVSASRSSLPCEISYLRVANVYRDELNLSEIKTIKATEPEIKRTLLQTNDILIVEGHGNPNEIGRCALWDGSIKNCIHQNHLIRLRCNLKQVHPTFVSRYMNSEWGRRDLLKAGKTTSGLNTISISNVRAVQLQLPPLSLQQEFAQRIELIDRLKTKHRESLAHLNTLFTSLQHRAFRGEL